MNAYLVGDQQIIAPDGSTIITGYDIAYAMENVEWNIGITPLGGYAAHAVPADASYNYTRVDFDVNAMQDGSSGVANGGWVGMAGLVFGTEYIVVHEVGHLLSSAFTAGLPNNSGELTPSSYALNEQYANALGRSVNDFIASGWIPANSPYVIDYGPY